MDVTLGLLAAALALAAGILAVRLKAARSEARESRAESARVVRAVEHLQEGLVLLGPRDLVLYANAAAVGLLSASGPPDPAGPPVFSRFSEHSPLASALQYHEPQETIRRVVEGNAPGGERQVLEVTVGPAGSGVRFILIRDLRSAETVDQRRRDFVANASHELQTPLAALIGMLDLVDTMPDEESRARLLERARANAGQLAALTRDLLGLAKAQDPRWRPAPQPVRLAALFEAVEAPLAEKAAAKGIAVRREVEPPDLDVLADAEALETAVRNLLDNALSYTEEGSVCLRASRSAAVGVVIEVEDTGPGIDAEILPRIFERFYRGDPARSRETGGTGLGLSIVRNLVGRLGGRIAVSTEPGAGSAFRIELPLSPARPLPGAGHTEFSGPSLPPHTGAWFLRAGQASTLA